MKIRNYLGLVAVLLFCTACPKDDDGPTAIPLRDRGEQAAEDDALIRDFLQTHFYNYEEFAAAAPDFNGKIVFDTIAGDNADKTPLIDQVTTKTFNRVETDQTIYILEAREGVGEFTPTFADSTFVNFRGIKIEEVTDDSDNLIGTYLADSPFDSTANPIWLDLVATIEGFAKGVAGSKPGSGMPTDPDGDGTFTFAQDYGVGAVFMPSGVSYYAAPPANSGLGLYANLVFVYDTLLAEQADHDNDYIPSILEDVNNNGFLFDDEEDNTDGDAVPNFRDPNDENDGVITRLEVEIETDDDGNFVAFVGFLDTDNDGTPDHLDTDDDGDGRLTINEIVINADGSVTYTDTDGDGTPDYLDADS
tara:strand:- start:24643 stop:25728 length:1086 start_codon:yes stop_codon:yes gene_type:complete